MNGKRDRTRRSPSNGNLEHLTIECVSPELDDARYPVKRTLGDFFAVGADIYKDGHDILAGRVRFRGPGDQGWRSLPLTYNPDTDRWTGGFIVDRIGRWSYTVDGWTDRFRTWRTELEKKVNAGVDVASELLEGSEIIESTARRARFGDARTALRTVAATLADTKLSAEARIAAALSPGINELMIAHFFPDDLTSYRCDLPLTVDRELARFGSWYELFPRSESAVPGKHGTFDDAARRLPRLAELGWDVIYLPPIHPIGLTHRKGKNNTLTPTPDDVGSPWAIGNENGGHTAIEPKLGTVEMFERFVKQANELGMEIALDYALQCSPDHPWVKEHPGWFHIRPDGTIKYAENPPKKYQDIYPINFWCEDREALWEACRDAILYWVARGVKIFRVDNPHTKPFAFWEWVIAEVQAEHPDTIFFAEAFTRPKKMKNLAKLGFTQSYTYFTWKNTSFQLRDFWREMFNEDALEYMRGNFFANTPDILNEYLVEGGRPAFRIRLLLAATMSPLYGIYSGYELSENVPVKPGSEEYMNSEKYEIRQRDYEAPGNLNDDIKRLNAIRRKYRALQVMDNLTFHGTENENILFFVKTGTPRTTGRTVAAATDALDDDILVVVNVNASTPHETMITVPLDVLGLGATESYVVEDLLTGARYTWQGARNYVRIDPALAPGHLFRLVRERSNA